MESLQPAPGSGESQESAQEQERSGVSAVLCVRLWAYGGPQEKLRAITLQKDPPLAEVVRKVITDAHGEVAEDTQSILLAQFQNPLQALSSAKSLQQRLLTFHREPSSSQVVAAVMVRENTPDNCTATSQTEIIAPDILLVEGNSAQILVTEEIYDQAKSIQGFEFSAKPVAASTDGKFTEAVYELLWTDESTYAHLRKSSSTTEATLSRERRYSIEAELGRGSMGVVYKAFDQLIGRTVALKTISVNSNFPDRDELIERLKQEAKAAGSLDHPNIITIYDVGQEEDLVYLSMQFLHGETLLSLMTQGKLPPVRTLLTYVDQICSAVGFAHERGVIHRDLKPANLMLTNHGSVKVLDFGIAKLGDASMTQSGLIVGTPNYMAPEQATGKKVDHRSDIFALGAVFYELFTHEKPFKGDVTTVLYKLIHEEPVPPSVVNPALPGGIDSIIRKALAKDPRARFQSCEEMRQAFRRQAELMESFTGVQRPAASPAVPAREEAESSASIEDLLSEARPKRSFRPFWITLGVLIFAGTASFVGWVAYVKSQTGLFPPKVEKVLVAMGKPPAITPVYEAPAPKSETSGNSSQPDASVATDATTSSDPAAGHGSSASGSPNGGAQPVSDTSGTSSASSSQAGSTPTPDNSKPASTTGSGTSAPQNATDSTGNAGEDKPKNSHDTPKTNKRETKSAGSNRDNSVSVEGFSRNDIPDLLRRADDAAGKGDYSQARYAYNLVLKLDHQNGAARNGLRRVLAAEREGAQR